MISIIAGNVKCKISGLSDSLVIKEFDQAMSYLVQGSNFVQNNYGWDGRQRLFTKNHYFPIGLLSIAEKILKKHSLEYTIIDNRIDLKKDNPLKVSDNTKFKTREYQQKAIDIAMKHNSGVIKMSTGSGKAFVLALLTGNYNVKTIIYVISIDLLYQMKDTFSNLYPDVKIGMVGDGHCDIQDITICTLWSAASAFNIKMDKVDSEINAYSKSKDNLTNQNKNNIKKMVAESQMLIIDECQFCGCNAAQLIHKESVNARYRFLFSATPWRDDNADILIESIAGPKIYDLTATELIKAGWLVQPKIYFINIPMKKHLGSTYHEVYSNYVVDNESRNELIIKSATQMVNKKRKVLILVNRINHGKILYNLMKDDFKIAILDGSDNSDKRANISNKMRNGELDIIIASRIFDQGVDIVNLDGLILACSGKSSCRALQRIGRVIRPAPDKNDAIVVDMIDNCKFLREHTKARLKIYHTEPGFKIIMPKDYYKE